MSSPTTFPIAVEEKLDMELPKLDLSTLFKALESHLLVSSQVENAEAIMKVIAELKRTGGVCRLQGKDEDIRPGMVGLQCLFEETFLATLSSYNKGDFEIHTTMPSTPCCKLPTESAKESLLAVFDDKARLMTVDGRSQSLDAIASETKATLHLTYTKAGYNSRTEPQLLAYEQYWSKRIHATCIESTEAFPSELNGATYRLQTQQGTQIYFGIQATQAKEANSKCMIIHLGCPQQHEISQWLSGITSGLKEVGRTLFEQ